MKNSSSTKRGRHRAPWVKPFKAPTSCARVYFDDTWCKVKKRCIKDWRTLISPWEALWDMVIHSFSFTYSWLFTYWFYVSNSEKFSGCERQYSYNERNTLKLRGNCERNFDGAFSSSFENTFFLVLLTWDPKYANHKNKNISTKNIRLVQSGSKTNERIAKVINQYQVHVSSFEATLFIFSAGLG